MTNHKRIKNTNKRKHMKRNRNRRTQKVKKMSCSVDRKRLNDICMNEKHLLYLKKIWNNISDDKIELNNPYSIWLKFKNIFSRTCQTEKCIIEEIKKRIENDKEKEILEKLIEGLYAPIHPTSWLTNKYEWLSTIDINNVMKMFERKYKCFKYIKTSPIDFDDKIEDTEKCVVEDLCSLNIKEQLENGKTKLGVVFNLDYHYQSGSHWVCMFINIPKGKIYFFDSYGDNPHYRIKELIKRVKVQLKELDIKPELIISTRRHQYGDSECGMYCIYFIHNMIKDADFNKKFLKKKVSDKYVNRLRKVYFNNPSL